MPPPTLLELATRTAMANVDSIMDVADLPYELARPILKRIENPEQLHEIEIKCPHIADQDAELWKALILRDVPTIKSLCDIPVPTNVRSWWKVYRKLDREAKALQNRDEDVLKKALQGESASKAKSIQLNKIVHVPCEEVAPGKYRKFKDPNRVTKSSQVKTMRSAKTGAQQIQVIKRQAAEGARRRAFLDRTRLLPQR